VCLMRDGEVRGMREGGGRMHACSVHVYRRGGGCVRGRGGGANISAAVHVSAAGRWLTGAGGRAGTRIASATLPSHVQICQLRRVSFGASETHRPRDPSPRDASPTIHCRPSPHALADLQNLHRLHRLRNITFQTNSPACTSPAHRSNSEVPGMNVVTFF
jgi:hypothetical protein